MASQFFVSSDVVFGKDSVKELPKMLKEYNAKNIKKPELWKSIQNKILENEFAFLSFSE